jgi:glycosyltransferase involved in cell wall biosynthesis
MNICLVTAVFPPCHGGMSSAAFYEAEELARSGHNVTVLTPDYKRFREKLPAEEKNWSFKVKRLPPAPEAGNTAICWNVLSSIENPDVVYLHYPFFGTAELIWLGKIFTHRCLKESRLVLRYHMDVMAEGLRSAFFSAHAKLLMPGILKRADDIIFSTLDYADSSHASWILKQSPAKCHGISYGIRPDRFFKDTNYNRDPDQILFVGGLDQAHHFKGLSQLFDAVASLSTSHPKIKLRVVGNGDMLDNYRTLCIRLNIMPRVEFITSCGDDELRKHYCESAVTLLPSTSRSEAFGIVLIESMACGTPVIATALPGVRTLIKEDSTGYLVPYTSGLDTSKDLQEKHSSALAKAITKIVDNPENAETMGKNAFNEACPALYWKTITQKIDEILKASDS